MSIRSIVAYTVVLTAIVGVADSVLHFLRDRRMSALEDRVQLVERDVNAMAKVEHMRTALPFPGDHVASRRRSS